VIAKLKFDHLIAFTIGYLVILLFWSVELSLPTLNVDDYVYIGKGDNPNIYLKSGRIFGYFENLIFDNSASTLGITVKYIIGLFIFYASLWTSAYIFMSFCSRVTGQKVGVNSLLILITSASIWSSVNLYTYELLSFDSAIISYSLCLLIFPFVLHYFNKGGYRYFFSLSLAVFWCLSTYQTALLSLIGLVLVLYVVGRLNVDKINSTSIISSCLARIIGVLINIILVDLVGDSNYERVSLFEINSLSYIFNNGVLDVLTGPWRNIFFIDNIIGIEIKLLLIYTHLVLIVSLVLFLYRREKILLTLSVSSCILWYVGWLPDAFISPKITYLNLRHVAPIISFQIILVSILTVFMFSRLLFPFILLVFFASVSSGLGLIQSSQRQSFINTIDAYVSAKYVESSRKKYNNHVDNLRHICGVPGWSRNSVWRSAFHAGWSYNYIFDLLEHPRLKLRKNECLEKLQSN